MDTERISPNNKPMISKRIKERKPTITSPTAILECARIPSKASLGNLVFFCKLNKRIAIMLEIKNTDKEIFKLKDNANETPSKDECDKVSPKYDKRRHITKHPRGPVTIAIPIPAIRALTKKSSNIILQCFHLSSGCACVYACTKKELILYVHQITQCKPGFLQHY